MLPCACIRYALLEIENNYVVYIGINWYAHWSLQTNTVLQGWRKVSITGGTIIKNFPDNVGHYLTNLTKRGGFVRAPRPL